MTDRAIKLARIASILDRHGASALALTRAENLAWLLDGARVTVPYGGPPVLSAVVERSGEVRVTAFANELDRLVAEELGPGLEVSAVPWHRPLPVPDDALPDTAVADELRAARASLLPEERMRYAALGADVAAAVTRVLRAARRDLGERDLAAALASAVVGIGAEPVVILVAGEGRLHHRHPLPTDAALGGRAIAVVGARRHGFVASLTRWVESADSAPHPSAEHEAAVLEVEADAFAATRPGRRLGDVLADIAASYERHGLGADAWLGHHQGGPTGYLGRDPRATPDATDRVVAGQAFAWNPSAPGAKAEDTVIVDDDRIEVLTVDRDWPVADVRGMPRPLPLRIE